MGKKSARPPRRFHIIIYRHATILTYFHPLVKSRPVAFQKKPLFFCTKFPHFFVQSARLLCILPPPAQGTAAPPPQRSAAIHTRASPLPHRSATGYAEPLGFPRSSPAALASVCPHPTVARAQRHVFLRHLATFLPQIVKDTLHNVQKNPPSAVSSKGYGYEGSPTG